MSLTTMPSNPDHVRADLLPNRRDFLDRLALALGGVAGPGLMLSGPALAQGTYGSPAPPIASGETRLALLLGNRNYPLPFDLPPVPKNVRDLNAVLVQRGFTVVDALDLELPAAHAALNTFIDKALKAPKDATLFFYFVGHGVQVDAANLLLPAGTNPSASSDLLRKSSLQLLDDVVRRLPEGRGGLTMAVVDACRTTLKFDPDEAGLNQVEAPPGCLIAFSTGAGKPAIAPAVETQNTFYTASLVKLMGTVPDETPFADLFQLVRTDVRQVMSNHPVAAIRKLAQDPFIADHSLVSLAVAPRTTLEKLPTPKFSGADEEGDWSKFMQTTWPAEVVQLSEDFLRHYPDSKLVVSAQVAHDGAVAADKVMRRSDVRLYRSAFMLRDDMDVDQRRDLVRCGRGDKDAAAREARRAQAKANATMKARYEGWLQYAAALGNGIASYELALHYRREDQPLLASQFESRARARGYKPPPTLDNVRK
jgi:hypothetical protein